MQVLSMTFHLEKENVTVSGNVIPAPYARVVRDGQVKRIDIFFPPV